MGEPKIDLTPYDQVSRRVNHLRFINGLSQKELSLRIGMQAATFSQKLNGGTRWNLEEVIALSDFFSGSLDYLIGRFPIESAKPVNQETPAASATGVQGELAVAEAGLDPATSRL